MNPFATNLSKFHSDILQQTHLGQLCGSQSLFRERYEIIRILGRGGFGVTFLAKDAVLPGHPLCVIKQLCPKVSNPKSWERARQRFEKEAKTLSQLGSHYQIPRLLDYFEANGEFYLVQEYVRGNTLAREVRRSGPKNEIAVKQFLREILPILQYVHENHVIHRDIKPQNIIRCEDHKRLVLIDFGAVKEELRSYGMTMHKTVTTNFVGTMGFAPPEQFSLRPVYASDIYAVGITCLYLLTAKPPLEFDHDPNTGEMCWQPHVNVSEHFAQVLSKMLKMSLEERYKSADEVMWALGLEPYLTTLTNCMSSQPMKRDESKSQESGDMYLPSVTRTAIAIRAWREKLKVKQSPHNRKSPGWLLSSGTVG